MAQTEQWVCYNAHPLLFLCVILNVVKDLLTLSLCIFRTEFSTNAFQILRDAQNDNLNAYPLLFVCHPERSEGSVNTKFMYFSNRVLN